MRVVWLTRLSCLRCVFLAVERVCGDEPEFLWRSMKWLFCRIIGRVGGWVGDRVDGWVGGWVGGWVDNGVVCTRFVQIKQIVGAIKVDMRVTTNTINH